MLDSLKSWLSGLRWKLITRTSKYPNADLHACFANLKKRGFSPRHVLDIGANQGKWSEPCRKVFPEAVFTLIEPQSEMKRPLDEFCRRSPQSSWHQMGVSNEQSVLPFIVYEDQVSSTFDFDSSQKIRDCEVRQIEVTTVNDLIESGTCKVPDILKIDAEGYEARILETADRAIGHCELVFLEAQLFNDQSECNLLNLMKLMDDAGYATYDFS
ncbi:MAG: FkbM family methyltransferase, partial [Planctomycetota bacterium]|nr:FkbM family methyltransferase [Planctomycetota bacterium]